MGRKRCSVFGIGASIRISSRPTLWNQPDRPGVRLRLLLPSRANPPDRTVCSGHGDDDLDALLLDRDDPSG